MINVQKIDTFSGHRGSVYALCEGAEPHLFYSSGADGMVVQWNLSQPDWGKVIAQIPASVYAMTLHKNILWIGQNYEGVQRIDADNHNIIDSLRLGNVMIFDIKTLDNQAFIAQSDGVVVVIDIEHFAIKKHIKASTQSARCIALNPETNDLAIGYSDNIIRIFDLHTHQLKHTLRSHTNSVFSLCYSPDGQYLLSGGRDAQMKIWNVTNDYILRQSIVAHIYAINHIVFVGSTNLFVSCSMDKSIKIWESGSFKLLKVIDKARHANHATSVNKILWQDNKLISCSDDKNIAIWNLTLPL